MSYKRSFITTLSTWLSILPYEKLRHNIGPLLRFGSLSKKVATNSDFYNFTPSNRVYEKSDVKGQQLYVGKKVSLVVEQSSKSLKGTFIAL